jgi:hypothetical protein
MGLGRPFGSLGTHRAPSDRRDYVPAYPGFEKVFGVRIVPAPPEAQLPLPERIDDSVDPASTPYAVGHVVQRHQWFDHGCTVEAIAVSLYVRSLACWSGAL